MPKNLNPNPSIFERLKALWTNITKVIGNFFSFFWKKPNKTENVLQKPAREEKPAAITETEITVENASNRTAVAKPAEPTEPTTEPTVSLPPQPVSTQPTPEPKSEPREETQTPPETPEEDRFDFVPKSPELSEERRAKAVEAIISLHKLLGDPICTLFFTEADRDEKGLYVDKLYNKMMKQQEEQIDFREAEALLRISHERISNGLLSMKEYLYKMATELAESIATEVETASSLPPEKAHKTYDDRERMKKQITSLRSSITTKASFDSVILNMVPLLDWRTNLPSERLEDKDVKNKAENAQKRALKMLQEKQPTLTFPIDENIIQLYLHLKILNCTLTLYPLPLAVIKQTQLSFDELTKSPEEKAAEKAAAEKEAAEKAAAEAAEKAEFERRDAEMAAEAAKRTREQQDKKREDIRSILSKIATPQMSQIAKYLSAAAIETNNARIAVLEKALKENQPIDETLNETAFQLYKSYNECSKKFIQNVLSIAKDLLENKPWIEYITKQEKDFLESQIKALNTIKDNLLVNLVEHESALNDALNLMKSCEHINAIINELQSYLVYFASTLLNGAPLESQQTEIYKRLSNCIQRIKAHPTDRKNSDMVELNSLIVPALQWVRDPVPESFELTLQQKASEGIRNIVNTSAKNYLDPNNPPTDPNLAIILRAHLCMLYKLNSDPARSSPPIQNAILREACRLHNIISTWKTTWKNDMPAPQRSRRPM